MQRIITTFVLPGAMLLCLVAYATTVHGQAVTALAPANVPLPVQQAFAKLYPNVKTVRWTAHSWRSQRHVVAAYPQGTERHFVRFTEGGKLLSAGRLFRPGELPDGIRMAAQTQHPNAQLRWGLEVQSAQTRARYFYVRLLQGKTIINAFFDADGTKQTESQIPDVMNAQVASEGSQE